MRTSLSHPFRDLVSSALLMLAVALVVAGIVSAAGCSSLRDSSRDVAGDVVDCTTGTARQHAAEYGSLLEATLRAATAPDGAIDWTPVKAAAAGFGIDTGACALAATVARLLAPPSSDPAAPQASPLAADPTSLRAGFAALRRELWGGREFRTELGVL